MDSLKEKFFKKSQILKSEIKDILVEHGEKIADQVTLSQIYGGARSIKMMIWETSALDANEGIRFRGYSIPELKEHLPKCNEGGEPKPEGLFWLMMTGDIPLVSDVDWLSQEWKRRSDVPAHVFHVLDHLPVSTHPMTQFAVAINALQTESIFSKKYNEGISKHDYWDPMYEDTMNAVAKLPKIAAFIYRRSFKDGHHLPPVDSGDWSGDFAHLLGYDDPGFRSLMRLYLTIHADHEGGNASAHTTHLVGSTLSDAYYSLAAGMNALAGPLHGLANQEVIGWIMNMLNDLKDNNPTREQIAEYVKKTLAAGQVIPGYGHAVLRKPDPRFMAQKEFAEKNLADQDIVQVVWKIYDVVPAILQDLGKVKNPWPNVDAHSGALLVSYGLKEHEFYTVLFGVSRALGVLASLCWSRALGMPLERPKSLTTEWVKSFVSKN
jgi:citrate synthase